MLSFLIRLPAYPNVRTESQSDIGHNRGKKKCKICFADKLIMVGIFDIFFAIRRNKSSQGFFLMLVPASTFEGVESEYRLVDWRNFKLRKVIRSSLMAETEAAG